MAVIRSMHADVPNHEPSLMLMNCGEARLIRPSMGSWLTYGLGTENQNLPAFVAHVSRRLSHSGIAKLAGRLSAGDLSRHLRRHQGNQTSLSLIANIKNDSVCHGKFSGSQLDLLQPLNQQHLASRDHDPQLEARIHSFELAYRMQLEATDAFDISANHITFASCTALARRPGRFSSPGG